jgi:uncharacterized glyoxalase superfamily protein PhnB
MVERMDTTVARAFVLVDDPDRALDFYRDALGFEVRNDVENEGFRWITIGAASQPDVSIVISNYLNDSPTDSETIAALIAKGGMPGVHLQTDDLDAAFERLQSSGAEIIQEPTDQFWGVRDCAVRDPSGNMLRIDQAAKS